MNLGRTLLHPAHLQVSQRQWLNSQGRRARWLIQLGWREDGAPRGVLLLLGFRPAPPVPGALRDHLCLPWLSSWDTVQGQGLAFVRLKWRHTQVPPQWLPGLSFLLEPVQLQRRAVWVQKAGLSTRGLVPPGRAHPLPALSSVYF